jgi:arsenate reductase
VDPVTIYVHPTCSKSRAATELLDARSTSFEVVNYLETPLDAAALGRLVDMLNGAPADLVRVDDARFEELGLDARQLGDRAAVIATLVAHPELMQRPVVVRNGRAVIARPPELLVQLLAEST